ncbi:MAG: outer membrane protein assembly factor BamD [Alphaproteobacteria bacterium]|nr:outer membrane protein assembly factor BamD [Alphaproteobacteria bacterium]
MKRRTNRLTVIIFAAAIALGACRSQEEPQVERPVDDLYNIAVNSLMTENYAAAARQFDEVERQHPYSVWATRSQLMAAYAFYMDSKYDEAISALDRFIQLNPANRDVAYAYYLKALCYYEQISDVQRDARMTELALASLTEVVNRFPNSVFARDARLKIELAHDHLAGKEMEVARFYQRQRQFLGAINRYRIVIDRYQTTSHVPEALHRLVECYLALGLVDEARRTASVLGHNYPGSDWYEDSFSLIETGRLPNRDQPGFIRRLFN